MIMNGAMNNNMFSISLLFDWWDIGMGFRIYKNIDSAKYLMSIDIYILWLNIWFQLFDRNYFKSIYNKINDYVTRKF